MRALVVGLGRMGGFHRRVLQDLGYKVDTVDPDPEADADMRSLPSRQYDVAAIAVPIQELASTAFMLAGTPMLVEKPFAPTVMEASTLGAYLEQKAPVCVGYAERFNPTVRRLRRELHEQGSEVRSATFTRWNDRPSPNPDLDLLTHDVDLAWWLPVVEPPRVGVRSTAEPLARCTFDYRDLQERRVRYIEIETADGCLSADLTAHNSSPLHGLWHAFLMGAEVPRPRDAVRALIGVSTIVRRRDTQDEAA